MADVIISDNPEDAGWTHVKLNIEKIKLNDVVELNTKTGLRLIGCVVCNKDNIIRIADPCEIKFEYIKNEDDDLYRFMTIFYPWRLFGGENFAQFEINDISNISRVESRKYVEKWVDAFKSFAHYWYVEGQE